MKRSRSWPIGCGAIATARRSSEQRPLGKGHVVWGETAEQLLAGMKVPVDFGCDGGLAGKLRYIHRTLEDGTELYFVANKREASVAGTCSFRVQGKRPEFWWPQSGRVQLAAAWQEKDGVTRVPVYLEATESVFVVFRPEQGGFDPVVAMTHDGKPFPPAPPPRPKVVVVKAVYGVPGDTVRTRNVKAKVQALIDAAKTSFAVRDMAQGDDPAMNVVKTLEIDFTVGGKPCHVSGKDTEVIQVPTAGSRRPTWCKPRPTACRATPSGPVTSRSPCRGSWTRVKRRLRSQVWPPAATRRIGVVKTLTVQYTVDGKPHKASGQDPETIELAPEAMADANRPAALTATADGGLLLEAWQNGRFEFTTASGRQAGRDGRGPSARSDGRGALAGEHSRPAPGAPEQLTLDSLAAWNLQPDDAVKYFSGTATYSKVVYDSRRNARQGSRPVSRSRPRGGHGPREAQRQ